MSLLRIPLSPFYKLVLRALAHNASQHVLFPQVAQRQLYIPAPLYINKVYEKRQMQWWTFYTLRHYVQAGALCLLQYLIIDYFTYIATF